MSRALEKNFVVCPQCHAPWHLHWVTVLEDGVLKRKYNTCGYTRTQLETKWIHAKARES